MQGSENKTFRKGIFWIPHPDEPESNDAYLFYMECTTCGDPLVPLTGPGIAKNGNNYNHKLLWNSLGRDLTFVHPFDYYPRGRVEIVHGKAKIFLHPSLNVDTIRNYLLDRFGLFDPRIRAHLFISDGSEHYQSRLLVEESEEKPLIPISFLPNSFTDLVWSYMKSIDPYGPGVSYFGPRKIPVGRYKEPQGPYFYTPTNPEEWHILDLAHWVGYDLYEKGLLYNILPYRFKTPVDCSKGREMMGEWIKGAGKMPSWETIGRMLFTPLQDVRRRVPFDKIRSIVCAETASSVDKDAIKRLDEEEDAILYLDYGNTQGGELREFIGLVRDVLKSRVTIYILSIS